MVHILAFCSIFASNILLCWLCLQTQTDYEQFDSWYYLHNHCLFFIFDILLDFRHQSKEKQSLLEMFAITWLQRLFFFELNVACPNTQKSRYSGSIHVINNKWTLLSTNKSQGQSKRLLVLFELFYMCSFHDIWQEMISKLAQYIGFVTQ